ncbi:hypothetical protein [Geodermatophilus sp. SYSU D00710]
MITGFAAVGDAWACTNPSAGRGLSVGLLHAALLRSVVAEHLHRPAAQDAGLFRAMLEYRLCMAPLAEVLARPEVQERVAAAEHRPPSGFPGPDRARLLELLAGQV